MSPTAWFGSGAYLKTRYRDPLTDKKLAALLILLIIIFAVTFVDHKHATFFTLDKNPPTFFFDLK